MALFWWIAAVLAWVIAEEQSNFAAAMIALICAFGAGVCVGASGEAEAKRRKA